MELIEWDNERLMTTKSPFKLLGNDSYEDPFVFRNTQLNICEHLTVEYNDFEDMGSTYVTTQNR